MSEETIIPPVGLFLLKLETRTDLIGGAVLNLILTVYTPTDTVTGYAEVTQPLEHPVVAQAHVTGVLIHETVLPPSKSHVRIDLTGYPEIHWPLPGGVGPVIGQNFKSIIVLEADYSEGTIRYQYKSHTGRWIVLEQKIYKVP